MPSSARDAPSTDSADKPAVHAHIKIHQQKPTNKDKTPVFFNTTTLIKAGMVMFV